MLNLRGDVLNRIGDVNGGNSGIFRAKRNEWTKRLHFDGNGHGIIFKAYIRTADTSAERRFRKTRKAAHVPGINTVGAFYGAADGALDEFGFALFIFICRADRKKCIRRRIADVGLIENFPINKPSRCIDRYAAGSNTAMQKFCNLCFPRI